MKSIKYLKTNYSLVFNEFKRDLEEFLRSELNVVNVTKSFGEPKLMSGSRETQYNNTYVRDVFHELEFSGDLKLKISYFCEESSQSSFDKSWMYSFNSFTVFPSSVISTKEQELIDLLDSFILKQGFKFYDNK